MNNPISLTSRANKWEERVYPAGDWALDAKTQPRTIMGLDDKIIWADEESLIVVGDTGYGKSTLVQNIIKTAIGLQRYTLGFPVREFERVLYVAADRPAQIKYSLARMVSEETRGHWNERVHIHEGPLGFWINEKPDLMSEFAKLERARWAGRVADCIVIDSLKDLGSNISDDENGIKVNMALQSVCREGIQLIITHHPRKGSAAADKKKPGERPALDDIFGSKFIPAGAGSVLFLHNQTDGVVNITQVKSPAGEVSFPRVCFNPETGEACAL